MAISRNSAILDSAILDSAILDSAILDAAILDLAILTLLTLKELKFQIFGKSDLNWLRYSYFKMGLKKL